MLFLPAKRPIIKKWIFCSPYSCNRSGLWPFGIWFYDFKSGWITRRMGIGLHFLWVADTHIEVEW